MPDLSLLDKSPNARTWAKRLSHGTTWPTMSRAASRARNLEQSPRGIVCYSWAGVAAVLERTRNIHIYTADRGTCHTRCLFGPLLYIKYMCCVCCGKVIWPIGAREGGGGEKKQQQQHEDVYSEDFSIPTLHVYFLHVWQLAPKMIGRLLTDLAGNTHVTYLRGQ